MIGLTEHSRLYINNKEVGYFFTVIVIVIFLWTILSKGERVHCD